MDYYHSNYRPNYIYKPNEPDYKSTNLSIDFN